MIAETLNALWAVILMIVSLVVGGTVLLILASLAGVVLFGPPFLLYRWVRR